jgi:threonine/homoserine/homoserine lactone efflux protein
MNGTLVFLRGAVLGFSIAAPVGPIGILCIRRTIADGAVVGLATGLGAAAADGLYGALAAFGLSWITAVLVAQQIWIRLVGGAFLLALGIRTLLSRPSDAPSRATGGGIAGAFASTFALTITNPMTILSFLAVFAGLGLGATGAGAGFALPLVAGVVLGSAAWWLLLSGLVGRLRSRFDVRGLAWVNRISGVLITGFGVLAVLSVVGGRLPGARSQ